MIRFAAGASAIGAAVALAAAGGLRLGVVETAPPVTATVFAAPRPEGLMVTSGGWAYCEQARPVARRTHYTLLCGAFAQDGYRGPGLRSDRHLDWGNPRYLAALAERIETLHRRVGGRLVLLGASYAGFGVAVLASRHPELRPNHLIVIDAYLDLVARRRALPDGHETAREIDGEAGTSAASLRQRSVDVDGLARLVRSGTQLTVVWSIAEEERRLFNGATCNREASAATLARLARTLGRPVPAWVTRSRHGLNLWRHGAGMVRGFNPGRRIAFPADGTIPPGAVCES